jgi:UDP-N-acetylglucosamine 1-carboxyvinyltransferase
MVALNIKQSNNINGEINISGAKNSALPLIASTILAKNRVTLTNMPDVADVKTLLKLCTLLGGIHKFENSILEIDTSNITSTTATYDIVRTMRASILTLGPLLARFGECKVSLPGGCAIGSRPVDLHLKALKQMGAEITIEDGYIHAKCERLKGATIIFDKITVTGSENIIMAAALAKGETKIVNVAKEPEVVQLCEVLQNAGVEISGVGSSEVVIKGSDGKLLEFPEIKVIPDRIEAGTYLCAGAITNSKLKLNSINHEHIEAIVIKLKEMGFSFLEEENSITILPADEILPVQISTAEYPAFPTDMQAQFMALATQANGVSIIEEKLFENRFMHVPELKRLGADIQIKGNIATIKGKTALEGADVMATDLRASSALVLAGLIASKETNIHRVYHLFRGYENLSDKLKNIGVEVKEFKE